MNRYTLHVRRDGAPLAFVSIGVHDDRQASTLRIEPAPGRQGRSIAMTGPWSPLLDDMQNVATVLGDLVDQLHAPDPYEAA